MNKRGWYIHDTTPLPRTYISVNHARSQRGCALTDLRERSRSSHFTPPKQRRADNGGAALQSRTEAAFGQLAASAGLAGTELPSEMAFINEVLDALPDELCNVFLVNYFNDLYV
jgi:hypothetical protein